MFLLSHYIHIGLLRTGSTWLQRLFADHSEICFVFRPQYFDYEDNWQKGPNYYKNLFKINKQHKAIVDSEEAYSLGRRYGLTGLKSEDLKKAKQEKVYPNILSSDVKNIAQRIYQTNPNAKIIMVLRRQPEWFISLYKRLIEGEGKNWRFSDFLNSNYVGKESLEISYYSKVVKLFFDLFGKENVLVLFYEQMRDEPKKFLKHISDFLNISEFSSPQINVKVRESISNHAIKLMRKANYITQLLPNKRNTLYYQFVFRLIRKLNKIFLKKIKDTTILSSQEKSDLLENYKQDNKELAKILNQDLKKWGYY